MNLNGMGVRGHRISLSEEKFKRHFYGEGSKNKDEDKSKERNMGNANKVNRIDERTFKEVLHGAK